VDVIEAAVGIHRQGAFSPGGGEVVLLARIFSARFDLNVPQIFL
jgi:hypothetical protein